MFVSTLALDECGGIKNPKPDKLRNGDKKEGRRWGLGNKRNRKKGGGFWNRRTDPHKHNDTVVDPVADAQNQNISVGSEDDDCK